LRSKFPEDLICYIVSFAIPRGNQVRLSWNDDEGQCDALVEAIAKNTINEMCDLVYCVGLSRRQI
jgi:hypothetical protein